MKANVIPNGAKVYIISTVYKSFQNSETINQIINAKIGVVKRCTIDEIPSMHGSSWTSILYTVIGEDGQEYFGSHNYSLSRFNITFLTKEEYCEKLKFLIAKNLEEIENLKFQNKKITKVLERL